MTELDRQFDFISANFISNLHLPEMFPCLKHAVLYVFLFLHGLVPTRWTSHGTPGPPVCHSTVQVEPAMV